MIDQVRPAQLGEWFSGQQDAGAPLVLDVRETWEVQAASIKPEGFELVAIPMMEIPARLAGLGDAGRPVAVLCHHGSRSQRVAAFLQQQGFERLANIAGGIDAWSAQVDPSVPRY